MIDLRNQIVPCVCLWLLAACHPQGQAADGEHDAPAAPIAVTCQPARTAEISDHVELRGSIHPPPQREVVVSPSVPGRLLEVHIHEGDHVTKGQVLATVDDPQLAADSTEADANRAAAHAALEAAQVALARAQRLFDQGIAARREVDEAQAVVSNADAASKAANARSSLASTRRARAAVTTPISGVVVKLHRAPGDLVGGTSQTPLADIADPTELELRADAPASALVQLRDGAPAEIRFDALPDRVLHGHVAVVAAAVDTQTGLGTVRIAIDKTDVPLKIGLAGRASVQLGASVPATLVPSSALRRSNAGTDEIVVCSRNAAGEHVADVRRVTLGTRQGGDVQLRQGVKPGELVVVDHALGLEEGAALETGATE